MANDLVIYAGDDEQLLTPIKKEQLDSFIICNRKRADNTDSLCKYPEQVNCYFIREEWVVDRSKNATIVRITGIAPGKNITDADGKSADKPLFWVKYKDILSYLLKNEAFEKGKEIKVFIARDEESEPWSWDEVLESRRFRSTVFRSDKKTN